MHTRSIRVTLTASIAAILVLLTVVSVSAVTGLMTSSQRIDTNHRKWLRTQRLFGDLRYEISEFRIAEAYKLFSSDHLGTIQADFLATRDAERVEGLFKESATVVHGSDMEEDWQYLFACWRDIQNYYKHARPELALDPAVNAGYGASEQNNFEVVRLAADNLIDDANREADLEVGAAAHSAWNTTWIIVVLATVAGLLSVVLMILIELLITRPLSAITSALLRLAGGDHSIRVPERHRRDEIGAMAASLETFRDNAIALADAQRRADELAHQDVLTCLPNRRHFEKVLHHSLIRSGNELYFAVLLIDLDRFKPVNDTNGHGAGDIVLCEIALRLQKLARSSEVVARIGGDEFAIITKPVPSWPQAYGNAVDLGNRIISAVSESIYLDHAEISLGASVGVAICPTDGLTADDILRAADVAMYRAKHDGRSTVRVFASSVEVE